ncbi:uncharacterized protein [Misgurnus anguillicaudatus]|uniref:uncharacterized protein n=1 Tax=Misgurnus anguillicaudatus TaxID=75329 RepID=UPI003CCF0E35
MKPWRKKFKWLSFCWPWQCSNLKGQQYASEVYIQTQAYFSETEIQQGTDAVPSSPDKVAKPLKDHVTPQHQTSLDDFKFFTHFPAITLVEPLVIEMTPQHQTSPVEEEELALWPFFTEEDLTQAQATEQERPPGRCEKRKKRKKPLVNTVTTQCQIFHEEEEEELALWPSFTEEDLTQAQATEQERPPGRCEKRKKRKKPQVNTVTTQCQIFHEEEEEELALWPSFTEEDLTQAQATEQERPPGRCEKRKKTKKPLVNTVTTQCQIFHEEEEEELALWPSFTEEDLTQAQATEQERPPGRCEKRKKRKKPQVNTVTTECQIFHEEEEDEPALWPSFTEEDETQAQATEQERLPGRCEKRKKRKKPQVNTVTTECQIFHEEEEDEPALWPSFTEVDKTQAQATEQERPPGRCEKRKKPQVNTVTTECQIFHEEEEDEPALWPSFTEEDETQAQATEQERLPGRCEKRKKRKKPQVNTVTTECQIFHEEEEDEPALWPSFTEEDKTQAQATEQERPPGRCEKRKKRKKPLVNTVTPQCQTSPAEDEILPLWPSFTDKDLTQAQATQQERPSDHCEERKIRKEPLLMTVTPQCQTLPDEDKISPLWPSIIVKEQAQVERIVEQRPRKRHGKVNKSKVPLHQAPHAVVEMLPVQERLGEKNVTETDHPEVIIQQPLPKLAWKDTGNVPVTQLDDLKVDDKSRPEDQVMRIIKKKDVEPQEDEHVVEISPLCTSITVEHLDQVEEIKILPKRRRPRNIKKVTIIAENLEFNTLPPAFYSKPLHDRKDIHSFIQINTPLPIYNVNKIN